MGSPVGVLFLQHLESLLEDLPQDRSLHLEKHFAPKNGLVNLRLYYPALYVLPNPIGDEIQLRRNASKVFSENLAFWRAEMASSSGVGCS